MQKYFLTLSFRLARNLSSEGLPTSGSDRFREIVWINYAYRNSGKISYCEVQIMAMTLAEKVFKSHLRDEPFPGTKVLGIDVVMCHEITTPIAINDLVARGKDRVFDPGKIKAVIDHVTPAKDTKTATQGKILRDWARRQNIRDFFDIGRNGVCHAIFPEHGFIRPGNTVIMGDSHTCTHGAFGAFAAGVGTTDLEVGILKGVCAFREPRTIRINIEGRMQEGVYAKDVILKVIRELTVKGATDCVIEFRGSVVDGMSMESRMTLCNMAIEAGGTSGICMPDQVTVDYLWPFISSEYRDMKSAVEDFKKWWSDEGCDYVKVVDIDVSGLEPQVTYGYKPDEVKNVSQMEGTPVDQVYIGSCTNGRIEDLRVAAGYLKGRTVAPTVRGIVSPATPKVFRRADEEGIIKIFMDAGFCVTNPTCGACLGMSSGVLAPGEVCASTTNRNFNGRMGKGGMVHLMSPAMAAVTAIEGKIADPRKYGKGGAK
jgi:3-isopropylmalate/(R)-2-methylmalate dehydratase large subunit